MSEAQDRNTMIMFQFVKYLLNKKEKSAFVIDHDRSNNSALHINIPRSIKHESVEYVIKSISKNSFSSSLVCGVRFATDSEIQIIDENSFSDS